MCVNVKNLSRAGYTTRDKTQVAIALGNAYWTYYDCNKPRYARNPDVNTIGYICSLLPTADENSSPQVAGRKEDPER